MPTPTVPTVAFNPANTIIPSKAWVVVTPAGATPGQLQVATATLAGNVTGSGNALVTVTGAGITGSPLALNVPVLNGDTAVMVAEKVAAFLQGTAAITALYSVSQPIGTATVILTRLTPSANDATLNIASATGTATGITAAPTSTATTLGVASAGVVTIVGRVVDLASNIETVMREVPDGTGIVRADRVAPKKITEGLKFETEDVIAIAALFGGVNNAFIPQATCELFVRDPQDAALTICLHSNVFSCDVKLDGGLNLKGGEVTKVAIMFNAHVAVIISANVTTTN